MQQNVPEKIEFSNNLVRNSTGKKVPHLFATAGYRFLLSEDINMIPSVMVKYVSNVPLQADVNIKLQYRDMIWAGASYRSKYGFAGMAGFNVLNLFQLLYAYDYSTTSLNLVSRGTHEILIRFMIGNKYSQDTCSRNVW